MTVIVVYLANKFSLSLLDTVCISFSNQQMEILLHNHLLKGTGSHAQSFIQEHSSRGQFNNYNERICSVHR